MKKENKSIVAQHHAPHLYKALMVTLALTANIHAMQAQTVSQFTTTDNTPWVQSKAKLSDKSQGTVVASIDGTERGTVFMAWGTTFNELDWDAFNLLSRNDQDEVMQNIFSPNGDLRFTHGRVSMNANDYARSWYSCDDVVGDFGLHYFNIERDKRNIIPLARAAQKYCPQQPAHMDEDQP